MTGGSEAGDRLIEELLANKPALDPRPEYKPASDVDEAVETAISLITANLYASLRSQLYWALGATESPIEGLFFLSLATLAARKQIRIEQAEKEYNDVAPVFSPLLFDPAGYLRVNVQPTIGEYRVDFLLQYSQRTHGNEGEKRLDLSKPALASFTQGTAHLIVECDGHDYHERTKEQAEADKTRDRMLQTVGYPVFRFTGSRLFSDPLACARECLVVLISRASGVSKDETDLLF
jgi:very-short-patch-repair endonuclease